MWKVLLIVSLISRAKACTTRTFVPVDELMTVNVKSPWVVVVTDITTNEKLRRLHGIGYGSLIHPALVLTAASVVSQSNRANLKVITDYRKEKTESADVQSLGYDKKFDKNNIKETDWAILLLVKPFKLSGKINIIKLASEGYDPNDCVIYIWRVIESLWKNEYGDRVYENGEVHEEYKVSLAPDDFGMNDNFTMSTEKSNCMIEVCPKTPDIFYLDFTGSPVICRLKEDRSQQVQVGFATLNYQATLQGAVASNGTLVDLSPDLDFIAEIIAMFSPDQ